LLGLVVCVVAVGLAVGGFVAGRGSIAKPDDPAAQPDASVGVSNCGQKPTVRPKELILTCADGGDLVKDLTWTVWSPTLAIGRGSEVQNVCEPDCAAGNTVTSPVDVYLHGAMADATGSQFTRLIVDKLRDTPGDVDEWGEPKDRAKDLQLLPYTGVSPE